MVWLSSGEKNCEDVIRLDRIYERDGQTDKNRATT